MRRRTLKRICQPGAKVGAPLRWLSVWGPGRLVMLADTDAGNIVTGAQAGAQWGDRLLPLVLLLIPMLYMVQELTVRLGICTGRGYGELMRQCLGAGWAWLGNLVAPRPETVLQVLLRNRCHLAHAGRCLCVVNGHYANNNGNLTSHLRLATPQSVSVTPEGMVRSRRNTPSRLLWP
jgi:hypothetical protein